MTKHHQGKPRMIIASVLPASLLSISDEWPFCNWHRLSVAIFHNGCSDAILNQMSTLIPSDVKVFFGYKSSHICLMVCGVEWSGMISGTDDFHIYPENTLKTMWGQNDLYNLILTTLEKENFVGSLQFTELMTILLMVHRRPIKGLTSVLTAFLSDMTNQFYIDEKLDKSVDLHQLVAEHSIWMIFTRFLYPSVLELSSPHHWGWHLGKSGDLVMFGHSGVNKLVSKLRTQTECPNHWSYIDSHPQSDLPEPSSKVEQESAGCLIWDPL